MVTSPRLTWLHTLAGYITRVSLVRLWTIGVRLAREVAVRDLDGMLPIASENQVRPALVRVASR